MPSNHLTSPGLPRKHLFFFSINLFIYFTSQSELPLPLSSQPLPLPFLSPASHPQRYLNSFHGNPGGWGACHGLAPIHSHPLRVQPALLLCQLPQRFLYREPSGWFSCLEKLVTVFPSLFLTAGSRSHSPRHHHCEPGK